MNHTRDDVLAIARALFPGSDPAAILEILDRYGLEGWERERVQLAILELSEGHQDRLVDLVLAAKEDYRDVLSWQAAGPLSETEGRKLQEAALRLMQQWGRK